MYLFPNILKINISVNLIMKLTWLTINLLLITQNCRRQVKLSHFWLNLVQQSQKLPITTTQLEIIQLKNIIGSNNKLLKDSIPGSRIGLENSVILTDDVQHSSQKYLQRFKNGSNYVHVYWWGLRIGLSKNTVNNIGSGVTIAGIWIPHPVVKGVVATLGVIIGRCPGGIVFNSTPGLASVWGFEFQ